MGEVRVHLELENSAVQGRRAAVDGVLDTGALVNWPPEPVIQQFGLQCLGVLDLQFADGQLKSREVYGPITLRIDGRVAVTDAVSGAANTEALLGVVTRERLDLLVDPVDQRLNPRHPDRPAPVPSARQSRRR